jgi:hypothetical protein
MKESNLTLIAEHLKSIQTAQKAVKLYSGSQIFNMKLLSKAESIARHWFNVIRPALQKAGCPEELLEAYSMRFEVVLRLSKIRPGKKKILDAITAILASYRDDLLHGIETNKFTSSSSLSIQEFIEGLASVEQEYLEEAQRCLSVGALRGCIVLGWCATIARIHAKIEEIGYGKFSKATIEMFDKTTGRFKFFKKKHEISSLSELQRVFDTDILWVLEYLGLIDGNQHERLRYCFEFRNNSAHPGLAPIKPANLISFYSDISEIVLNSPKFQLQTQFARS